MNSSRFLVKSLQSCLKCHHPKTKRLLMFPSPAVSSLFSSRRFFTSPGINPQNLVIDVSFDDHMSLSECKRLALEIFNVYQQNSAFDERSRFNINVCNSLGTDSRTMQLLAELLPLGPEDIANGLGNDRDGSSCQSSSPIKPNLHLYQQSYLQLFPVDRLVYLSPDSDNRLTFDPDDIYIIGGHVDKFCFKNKTTKNLSLSKALDERLRNARLPIEHLFNHRMHKVVLFLPQVSFILSRVKAGYRWEDAARECLPEWKLRNGQRLFAFGCATDANLRSDGKLLIESV